MRALGNIADRDQAQSIVTAYTDQAAVLETKPEVRAAFIYAIGKIIRIPVIRRLF